ncbi:MAG: multicomponent Na+:H+ antiporter subunit [Clostridia bacterium]|nr:multicomponent Na+:H+ antiporter subunit [Clostridia bacterium]MDN5323811.1 multicomponent Na+:H+ antiporter subunit [Clostridia bacterium]
MKIIASIFLLLGFFFILVAAIGVMRLPDFYTRLHASGKSETLGMLLSFIGLALYEGMTLTSIKLMFIVLFILLANPIGTHIICREAYRCGLKPWMRKGD